MTENSCQCKNWGPAVFAELLKGVIEILKSDNVSNKEEKYTYSVRNPSILVNYDL